EAEQVYEDLLKKGPDAETYRGLFRLYQERDDGSAGQRVLNLLDPAVAAAVETDKKPGSASEAARARAMLVVLRQEPALVKEVLTAAERRLYGGPKLAYGTRRMLAVLAARTRQLAVAEKLYRSCLEQPGGLRLDREPEVYEGLLRVLSLAHK